ncbi:Gldg family protein [Gillisia sp. M10.2A]|uniref:Gldg family protein n=1 Tax=Gillisia lutea TaxID=2909668 RepID=A0ABS9ED41_9FLAO|nr:DUF4350 domain-containing protein [Gillisia lutea]MCF4100781.1 Gldg family protein [Gillisia lutea]
MKKIYKIAKLELSILFYSPIAWIVLIIFIVQCGVTFTGLIDVRETSQQLGQNLKGLTVDVFGGNQGFFAAVQNKLYLYIPLLTMGLMSREISSGSIKLLYSSPITNQKIIFGKFLAMMLYGLLLVIILGSIVAAGLISIESLDVKFVLGGVLGLYLLICAYSAIGLFMSSLTSYQVVAAISTLAVLAALNFVGNIGQSIDYVRDITYWISITGRADNFINGLISSKDVIYFLLVIGLFLALTITRLNSGRVSRSGIIKTGKYATFVIAVLLIGYISSLPAFDGYYDTTRFKDRTLTENSQELIKRLDKPVSIDTYVNVINSFSHLGSPKFRIFDLNKFNQYTRFLPDLDIKYTTYYDSTLNARDNTPMTLPERAKRSATAYGFDYDKILSPEELRANVDLRHEENMFVRKVRYGNKETSLRMFYDMLTYPGEAEISAALKRLITSPAVVGVLTGKDERDINKTGDKGYKDIFNSLNSRGSLINQGFDVVEVKINSLSQSSTNLTVLVIADPFGIYSEEEISKINTYIDNGGNLIIAGEPGKQDNFNPLLHQLGLAYTGGTLLQESEDYELDLLQTHITEEATSLDFNLSAKDIISFSGAVGISVNESSQFDIIPVITTEEDKVWNKEGEFDLETDEIKFGKGLDTKTIVPVGMALTRKHSEKQQKIMVFGDADFMSNGELGRFNLRTENYKFIIQMFKWFSGNEYPIDTSRPDPIDNRILLSRSQISWMETFFLGLFPVSIALSGAFLLIRRKRK